MPSLNPRSLTVGWPGGGGSGWVGRRGGGALLAVAVEAAVGAE